MLDDAELVDEIKAPVIGYRVRECSRECPERERLSGKAGYLLPIIAEAGQHRG